VVVEVGETVRVPPDAGTELLLPSVPVTVMLLVAFEAVTVRVSDDPEVMALDLAVMERTGAALEATVRFTVV